MVPGTARVVLATHPDGSTRDGLLGSAPPGQSPTLEDLVEDLLAIMEDAYVERPMLMGGFESGFIAMMAAATHPERFDGLILFGPAPSWGRWDELAVGAHRGRASA